MSTLDEITKEKRRVSEALAHIVRYEPQRPPIEEPPKPIPPPPVERPPLPVAV